MMQVDPPSLTTNRILRLLRPYTNHIKAFQQTVEADQGWSLSSRLAQQDEEIPPSPFAKLLSQPQRVQRTYGKSTRILKSQSAKSKHKGEHISDTPEEERRQHNRAKRQSFGSEIGSKHSPKASGPPGWNKSEIYGSLRGSVVKPKGEAVVHAFTNLCAVCRPLLELSKPSRSSGRKSGNSMESVELLQRGPESLRSMCASVVGDYLSDWLEQEQRERRFDMDGEGEHCETSNLGRRKERETDLVNENWRVERLGDWYDAIPVIATGDVLLAHALSLTLKIWDHPATIPLLWAMLSLCAEHGYTHGVSHVTSALCNQQAEPLLKSASFSLLTHTISLSPLFVQNELHRYVLANLTSSSMFCLPSISFVAWSSRPPEIFFARVLVHALVYLDMASDERQDDILNPWLHRWAECATRSSRDIEEVRLIFEPYLVSLMDSQDYFIHRPKCLPYLHLIVVFLMAYPQSENSQTSIALAARRIRKDPGIPFISLPLETLTRGLHNIKTINAPHLESWIIMHLIEFHLTDGSWQEKNPALEEQLREAETRCVLKEREERLKVDGSRARGGLKRGKDWSYDEDLDSWVEMTPVSVKTDKRYKVPMLKANSEVLAEKLNGPLPRKSVAFAASRKHKAHFDTPSKDSQSRKGSTGGKSQIPGRLLRPQYLSSPLGIASLPDDPLDCTYDPQSSPLPSVASRASQSSQECGLEDRLSGRSDASAVSGVLTGSSKRSGGALSNGTKAKRRK